ncbi:MAG: glycosyltransferase [Bacteroidota bacterium]|nr:glycosyltransferase [Bacteroidota bacterium]
MKIAQVFYGYGGGGAPNVALTLTKEFKKQGHDVDVILINEPYDNFIHEKCDFKLKQLRVNQIFLNRKQGAFGFKAFFRLLKILKNNQYDVVHSHLFIPDLFVALSQKLFQYKFKHVVTVHNSVRYHPKVLVNFLFNKTIFVRCSAAIKELAAKQKEFVVPNAINFNLYKPTNSFKKLNLRQELGLNDNATLIISVGNLRPQKNQKAGIDMIYELKNNYKQSNFHYLICGLGQEEANLKHYAHKLGVYKNIHFMGLRDDIPDLLNNSDIFINCSMWEGLPLAVIEAFVSGIPTILSPINEHKIISKQIFKNFISKDLNGNSFALSVMELNKQERLSHQEIFDKRSMFLNFYSLDSFITSYQRIYEIK